MILGYSNNSIEAFDRVQIIILDISLGWLVRFIHINFVRFFFMFVLLHFCKGLLYNSYCLTKVWVVGVSILLFLIIESFLGYVLVWSQMSFWACTVITRLVVVVPYFGYDLLLWVWSNFYVSSLTLKLFLTVHFAIPILILIMIVIHLLYLHETCSRSKLYIHTGYDKVCFIPYYWTKDLINVTIVIGLFALVLFVPYYFNDCEMFQESNHLVSPVHIVPEWYFLFAYGILRSVENKLLGVMLLVLRVAIWYLLVWVGSLSSHLWGVRFWMFLFNLVLLSWLGSCYVEQPFRILSIIIRIVYFKALMNFFVYDDCDSN